MTLLEWGVAMILFIVLIFLAVSVGYVARGVENNLELSKDRIVVIHKNKCK